MHSPRQIGWAIANLGVDESDDSVQVKHVRLCNIAAAATATASLLFGVLEWWVIRDEPRPGLLFAGRLLAVAPFVAVLFLAARRRHGLARLLFTSWCFLFMALVSLYYGRQSPLSLFLLPAAAATLAIFRPDEGRRAAAVIGLGLAALLFVLVMHIAGTPLVVVMPHVADRVLISVTLCAFALAVVVAGAQRRLVHEAEERLAAEKQRSEELLLNILPSPIAERLKRQRGSIADGFDSVTVLFADLVGFTSLSQHLEPAQVVGLMDEIVTEFDRIAESLGLEKIKTIGDCYMVAAGLPLPREDHAAAMAEMALRMLPVVERVRAPGGETVQIRIGMASGPVVAGVIGRTKFAYDLWGDTVNTASRMESHGVAGRIHLDEGSARLLEATHEIEDRGVVEVKGKGPLRTWFLIGRKAAANA